MLLLLPTALAASIDNLEVGGLWGTPTSSDPTAFWWNPGALAAGEGTRILLEGAPTYGRMDFDRDAEINGGQDSYLTQGIVPFAGVVTDFGVDGLAVGGALAVPIGRGGVELQEPGPGSFHMREGHTTAVYLMGGAGYRPIDQLSLGATISYVSATWYARLDNSTLRDLESEIRGLGQDPDYTDELFEYGPDDDRSEPPPYGATVEFDDLEANALTWGGGLLLQPTPPLSIGVAWQQGVELLHHGPGSLDFGCPPQADTLGRFGAESYGICDTSFDVDASIAFALPSRLHLGVAWQFERLRAEVFGGYVRWSAYDQFEIVLGNAAQNEGISDDTADLIDRTQIWARNNRDSGYGALDLKLPLLDRFLLGGRLMYDLAAVPGRVLSPNNYDANTLFFGALGAVSLVDWLQLGASWSHQFAQPRTVTESAWAMTLDEWSAVDDDYYYPSMNGTYTGRVDRFGVALRSAF